ncbi:MBL fold metallo-hydrolase [Desulfitobacterium metallireducens]|uniref:Beta-lactamase n=1 Tax=Desulfitobacterium metallireducens DSM 15288 TaxID=871968 RepID=W0EBS6_9FIRM|nr:MBL fold metallo-hydrolase [Desulfitobacterium metallireducens]AHF08315.1 beta-lactamase [Desulfitobacterium metallireducens DSM 15288]
MHFATLVSGSSGNATVVGHKNRNFLVDCGVSLKALLHNLELIDISSSEIEGIIVTHEHKDHIKGIGPVARKLKIPIYATAGIWEEMTSSLGKIDEQQKVIISDQFSCAGLDVQVFPTSHDSRESYGFRIQSPETGSFQSKALGIATDTGIITEEMNRYLKGCDGLVVEANHDGERLWNGRYPWYLKKRISGDRGHLENKQLAEGLLEWIQENTERVVLAHLSEENNTPELALSTILKILKNSKVAKENPELRLRVAPRHTPHELIILGED